jgi:hypothetical protein
MAWINVPILRIERHSVTAAIRAERPFIRCEGCTRQFQPDPNSAVLITSLAPCSKKPGAGPGFQCSKRADQ